MKLFHNKSSHTPLCMHNIVFSLEIIIWYFIAFYSTFFSRRN